MTEMAKGDWWFKFEIPAWRNSPELRKCSLETRGFWIDCIAIMRDTGKATITGTYRDFARSIGCFPDEAEKCIDELRRTKTADVTLRNNIVTVKSRKYARELKAKELTRLRVRKLRSNANVTPEKRVSVISKELEVRETPRGGHGETPKESSPNGHSLSPSFPDSEYLSGRPRAVRGFAATPAAEELDVWLEAIAKAVGAKSPQTMASAKGWNEATIAVIREGGKRERWLEIIESERDRNRDTPQFFTPNSCLKIFQSESTKPKVKKFYH